MPRRRLPAECYTYDENDENAYFVGKDGTKVRQAPRAGKDVAMADFGRRVRPRSQKNHEVARKLRAGTPNLPVEQEESLLERVARIFNLDLDE